MVQSEANDIIATTTKHQIHSKYRDLSSKNSGIYGRKKEKLTTRNQRLFDGGGGIETLT